MVGRAFLSVVYENCEREKFIFWVKFSREREKKFEGKFRLRLAQFIFFEISNKFFYNHLKSSNLIRVDDTYTHTMTVSLIFSKFLSFHLEHKKSNLIFSRLPFLIVLRLIITKNMRYDYLHSIHYYFIFLTCSATFEGGRGKNEWNLANCRHDTKQNIFLAPECLCEEKNLFLHLKKNLYEGGEKNIVENFLTRKRKIVCAIIKLIQQFGWWHSAANIINWSLSHVFIAMMVMTSLTSSCCEMENEWKIYF